MSTIKTLSLLGLLCLLMGVTLLVAVAQDDEDESPAPTAEATAEMTPEVPQAVAYVGSRECADCHRDDVRRHNNTTHALTLQSDKKAILADFSTGESLRTVLFPEENTPRAFTAEDVAFVLGTGKFAQAYLYRVGRDEYRVFPAEWDVASQTWRALDLAESWDSPAYDWEQSCVGCHTTGFDPERERWRDDGVQCEACHGAGETHVELAKDAGRRPNNEEQIAIRNAIYLASDAQTCGQCHSRGVGIDGRPYPIRYIVGTDLASVFTITPQDDAVHWWQTGHARLTNMQYNEWAFSSHAEQEVTCTSCHNPHSRDGFPANLVKGEYALCLTCHSSKTTAQEGIYSPVQAMWEGLAVVETVAPVVGVHFNLKATQDNAPTCTTCHMPSVETPYGTRISHAIHPILPQDTLLTEGGLMDSCSSCHAEVVPTADLQRLIDDIQTSTRQRLETARNALTSTTPEWVTTALDFVEGDGSFGIHNYAYTDALLDAVETELALITGQ